MNWGFLLTGEVACDPSADWSGGLAAAVGIEVRVTVAGRENGRVFLQAVHTKQVRGSNRVDQSILWERKDDFLENGAEEKHVLQAVAAEARTRFRLAVSEVVKSALEHANVPASPGSGRSGECH